MVHYVLHIIGCVMSDAGNAETESPQDGGHGKTGNSLYTVPAQFVWYAVLSNLYTDLNIRKSTIHCPELSKLMQIVYELWISSVDSPICQEGQSETTFLSFPLFLDFLLILGKFFAVNEGTLLPLPPYWLRHCFEWSIFVMHYACATKYRPTWI